MTEQDIRTALEAGLSGTGAKVICGPLGHGADGTCIGWRDVANDRAHLTVAHLVGQTPEAITDWARNSYAGNW